MSLIGTRRPPFGVGGSGVKRLRGLDDGEFWQALVDNEMMNPLARAVRGERQRKFMAAVSTVVNSHRTCCIPFVSVWRLSRFCIAYVVGS